MKILRTMKVATATAALMMLISACSGNVPDPTEPANSTDSGSNLPEEDSGLEWDQTDQNYVMEPEVLSGDVPLRVWIEGEDIATALMDAFNDVYPDVQFEWENIAKVDTAQNMSLAGEAGNGADVFISVYDQLAQAIEDGTAAPLGKYQEVISSRVPEAFSSIVSKDGQMYAVPITTESIGLFYNKTLLSELTGSSEPATTWEEIIELAQEYNDPATNQWTIRFVPGEIYYAYGPFSSAGWQLYPSGDIDQPGFDDPLLLPALEYYQKIREIWNVPSSDATWDSVEGEFANGKTPYAITGPWSFSLFNEGAATEGFEYGVTTLPVREGGEHGKSMAGIQIAVVSGYSQYPAAARVFANFLASDQGASVIYETSGMIPAVTEEILTGIDGVAGNELIAGIVAQSARAELLPQIPAHFWDVGNELAVNVWDGLLPLEDAQQRAIDSYSDLANL